MAIRMTGLTSGLDTESIVEALMSAQKMKTTKIKNKLTKSEWTEEIWKDMNKKLYSFYTTELTKFKTQGSYLTKKATSSNESVATATATNSAAIGSHTLAVESLASAQMVTGAKIDDASSSTKSLADLGIAEGTVIKIDGADGKSSRLEVTSTTTIADFVDSCRTAGLNANFDASQKRLFISSSKSGKENAFSITTEGYVDGTTSPLEKLGLQEIDSTKINNDIVGNAGFNMKCAKDASIVLDGARLTGSSNNFSVNGLTLNLISTTQNKTTGDYDEITLNVSNDTKAAYDMVKNFVKKYNELLDEMNKKYSAESARGYDPLTDEQKEAMTDDEVEKWENKIKDSLLRRDDTLSSIVSTMRSSLQVNVEVDGKKYSLTSFGIKTSSDYTEKGKLHICGDEEDDTYATENNDLMEALEKNPDAVMKTLAQAGQNLYDAMTKKMSKTSLSSALTFYNDKQMDNTQSEYKKKIKELEKKLTSMEDRYYKQFTAMEAALTKMQNSASAVTSLFGGS